MRVFLVTLTASTFPGGCARTTLAFGRELYMSDTTTSGDRPVTSAGLGGGVGALPLDVSVNEPGVVEPARPVGEFVGRSPGQLAWMRLRRDRVAVASFWILVFFICLVV